MLNNKRVTFVISLIIAIVLWAYVVGNVNPTSTIQLKDIPIAYTHQDVLAERGLAVSGVSAEKVDLEVTGSRADLKNLNVEDIYAIIDVATAVKGENEISLTTRQPSGITITRKSVGKVSVIVENMATKNVNIDIAYTGTFKENESGSVVSMSTDTVDVSGAESLVNIVEKVVGNIDASRVQTKPKETSCELVPVNKDGKPVAGVSLSQQSINVTSVISVTKSVKLTVPVTDKSSDNYMREITAPDQIMIVGTAEDIKDITAVKADEIDISNIGESTEIPIEFSDLPKGIEISSKSDAPKLKLTVYELKDRDFSFNADEIVFQGKNSSLAYKASSDSKITVTVRGKSHIIDALTKPDIKISADVSQLKSGTTKVPIIAAPAIEIKILAITADPSSVDVTVSAK